MRVQHPAPPDGSSAEEPEWADEFRALQADGPVLLATGPDGVVYPIGGDDAREALRLMSGDVAVDSPVAADLADHLVRVLKQKAARAEEARVARAMLGVTESADVGASAPSMVASAQLTRPACGGLVGARSREFQPTRRTSARSRSGNSGDGEGPGDPPGGAAGHRGADVDGRDRDSLRCHGDVRLPRRCEVVR